MIYRKLGGSELELPAVVFGAWAIGGWMWGGTDINDAHAAIHKSLDLGVNAVDTAPVYGFGLSEEIVGKALAGIRKEVLILTKFGLRWDTDKGTYHFKSENSSGQPVAIHKYAGKESVVQECEDSLRRLRTDYIDLLQIHWDDPSTPIGETFEAVDALLKAGKIRAAGVCNYTAAQVGEAAEKTLVASDQVPYSMLLRDIEKDLVPYCLENNVGILAYSPLQRGLLSGKFKDGHVFAEGDHRPSTPFYKPENIRKTNAFLERIRPMAEQYGATLAQLVLNWTFRQEGITCVLTGARDAKQAEENARAASFTLSDGDLAEINRLLAQI